MKFQTLTTFLLPITGVLANPIDASISARQTALRATFDPNGFSAPVNISGGCNGAVVTYSDNNEVATILIPNYYVTPFRPSSQCHVAVKVIFPPNVCTKGSFLGTPSGIVDVPAGVTGNFVGRDYSISPSIQSSKTVPQGVFPGPQVKQYTLQDKIDYTVNRPDSFNNVVTFTLQGQLQLQPASGLQSGLLSNQQIIFNITDQGAC